MKHTFILLLAAITFSLSFKSYSQEVNITTATIEYGTWVIDPKSEGHWEMSGPPTEFISLFNMSKAHTTITHITDNRKLGYIIGDNYYNEEKDRLELEVTSDTVIGYTSIIDDRNENIRFIYEEGDALKLVRYAFKKVW